MSRDFTPAETYAFWQQIQKQGGESLLDSMESTLFSYNGKTSPLYSEESMKNRRQYPLLGSLYAGRFDDLYGLLTKTENGTGLLKKIENELNTIIQTKEGNENSYVFKWFVGDLDPGFHYSQENDRLFFEAIQDELTYCPRIDETKISDTARVSVSWDSFGITVDLNYSHDVQNGYGESVLCFCETYDNGRPDEEVWDEAWRIGEFLKDRYGIPLDLKKDEAFIKEAKMKHEPLEQKMQSAASRAKEASASPQPEKDVPHGHSGR